MWKALLSLFPFPLFSSLLSLACFGYCYVVYTGLRRSCLRLQAQVYHCRPKPGRGGAILYPGRCAVPTLLLYLHMKLCRNNVYLARLNAVVRQYLFLRSAIIRFSTQNIFFLSTSISSRVSHRLALSSALAPEPRPASVRCWSTYYSNTLSPGVRSHRKRLSILSLVVELHLRPF